MSSLDNNPFSLEGKTILVTGASSGIGRGIAILCSKMGAKVVITGRNLIRLSDTREQMTGTGHFALTADLDDADSIECFVSELPNLDGVVHCAGIGSRVTCKNIEPSDIEKVFAINTFGPILLQKHLLSAKKINKRASIVFIASMASQYPSAGNAVYSASKGAIISYAKVLAIELANRLIRVNCISPAMVWTPLVTADGIDKEVLEEDQKKYPLKRYGTPEDVANLAVFLLSDASSWMTGSNVELTGGGRVINCNTNS